MSNFITNIKLNKNQLIEAVVQKLAAPPQSPVSGQIYYNTVNNRLFVYNGSEWIGADAIGATMTGADIVTAINGQGNKINLINVDLGLFSSTQDGLVPKGSGSTKYLRGDGTWQTPPDTKTTVVDNLTSTSATNALSANQGKVLDGKISTAITGLESYTDQAIADLIGSAPEVLDTLEELAQALGGNANFSETILQELAKRAKKFSESVGDGSLTTIDVTHNLGTRDVVVTIRENVSPYSVVFCDVEMTTDNKITLKFAKAPTLNQYKITVVG